MLHLLLVLSLVSGAGADPMIGEILHLLRSLEKRAASAAVTDSIAHRLANPVASSPINSIQRGTIAVNNVTSATATITSVNTAKSFLSYLGLSTSHNSAIASVDWHRIALTNATTVTADRGLSGGVSVTVSYEVLEFK